MNLTETETKLLIDLSYISFSGRGKYVIAAYEAFGGIEIDDYWNSRQSLIDKGLIYGNRELTQEGIKVRELFISMEKL